MPVIVPDKLPASQKLREENVSVMEQSQARKQDIRPLHIIILNLMPLKAITETHLLRLLTNTPLQIYIDLLHIKEHVSKNTPKQHLDYFYRSFDEIKDQKYDGMIITGAPVEQLPFDQVRYWPQLKTIMDWARANTTSSFYICWGAQAALQHFYGIPKYQLKDKMFGNFNHYINAPLSPIARGFDDGFTAPHSRYTEIRRADIEKHESLQIVSESKQAGIYLLESKDGREVYATGHSEYDPATLKEEYERDRAKGLGISVPHNYFPDDDPGRDPIVRWRSHAHLLFQNWLNYYVYQRTPYRREEIGN